MGDNSRPWLSDRIAWVIFAVPVSPRCSARPVRRASAFEGYGDTIADLTQGPRASRPPEHSIFFGAAASAISGPLTAAIGQSNGPLPGVKAPSTWQKKKFVDLDL